MTKPARFTQKEVETAFAGARKAGIAVALVLQPDGSLAIVPADRLSVTIVGTDLDERIAKFAAK